MPAVFEEFIKKFPTSPHNADARKRLVALGKSSGSRTVAGFVTIKAKHSGKCLDIFGAEQGDQIQAQQYDCNGGDNQRWELIPESTGFYTIKVAHSGKCLGILGAELGDQVKAEQSVCTGGNNQKWELVSDGAGYYTLKARHSGKCLDIFGSYQQNQAKAQQYGCHAGNNQKWQLLSTTGAKSGLDAPSHRLNFAFRRD